MKELPINKIICGDALEVLKTFPSESIDMVMTSPPYWGLRDYGIDGQIGLEEHPKEYIRKLVLIFREVKRVLKKTGSFYLNMGDTYFGSGAGTDKTNQEPQGKEVYKLPYGSCRTRAKRSRLSPWLQPKQLLLMPSRVAIALQEDGWILRNDICWAKPNAMPSSVKDRLNTTWEHVFHFVKARRYYYDLDAIREKHATSTKERLKYPFDKNGVVKKGTNQWTVSGKEFPLFNPLGKNPGDVIKIKQLMIGNPNLKTFIEKRNSKYELQTFLDPENY
ncbi:MAG: DNA-methyltransferase, partial [Candidatus Heimdallarchaeaceae archaeon]